MGRATVLTSLALACVGCGAASGAGQLETLGVHVERRDPGWYRLRSDAGYSFELPGVPRAEREEHALGGALVPTVYYRLMAEMSSRGYLVRVYDARELDPAEREELRARAEERLLRSAEEVSARRRRVIGAVAVHEAIIEPLSIYGHIGLVRTFVRGPFVFEIVTVLLPGGGPPDDARRVVGSVRADGGAPPLPEGSFQIPAEEPND